MHKMRLAAGLCLDLLGSLQRSTDLLDGFKVSEKGRKGKGKEGKGRRDGE